MCEDMAHSLLLLIVNGYSGTPIYWEHTSEGFARPLIC